MIQIKTTLYALNKDGSFQEWKVFTLDADVIVQFGKLGGKVQQKVTQCAVKNVGRSNEKTGEQQALLEAQSKWEKQVRLGYRESIDQLETEENFAPMLAQDAIKRSRDIIYPCFVQPKLDGLRCLVTFDDNDTPVFNSRGNKTYPIQGEIPLEIKSLKASTGFQMFDGEVYLHGLSLQKIVSLAKKWRTHKQINEEIEKDYQADLKRRQKAIGAGEPTYKNFNKDDVDISVTPEPDYNRYCGYESADLMFSIFDIPSKGKVWDSCLSNNDMPLWDYDANPCRYADLMNADHWTSALSLQKISIVHGNKMQTEAEVKDSIGFYMTMGYEGAIIRNYIGLYEFGQRSTNLQKWKIFQDSEAKVVDYTIDKNNEAVLHCIEKDGTRFKCKMKGTFLDRNENAAKKIVDKFINFTFQQRSEDGIPIFPVGQNVREVDTVTWQPVY